MQNYKNNWWFCKKPKIDGKVNIKSSKAHKFMKKRGGIERPLSKETLSGLIIRVI
jgi:hypothetical protein